MVKREIGGFIGSAAAIVVAFLLPLTFPRLSGWPLWGAWIVCAAALVVGGWLFFHKPKEASPPAARTWKNVREFFETDFSTTLKVSSTFECGPPEEIIAVEIECHRDFETQVDFLSIYVPPTPITVGVITVFARHARRLYRELVRDVGVVTIGPGDVRSSTSSAQAFPGRVFVYHDTHLEPREAANIVEAFEAEGLNVQLRGLAYAAAANARGTDIINPRASLAQ
ncbi:hypothetical protein KK137_06325 [Croceibacterium sp. LX-88]|uniref:Restriction endonuclease type IV Mrr domain-containing protein n=1 Tax=Croceibacterium selenioxidans TaxID=2838833 RepID=A0ABS5W2G3_9SPHN|nr:hypothetical protein [Croceibacterium selenioxidans]MBT2133945.1 hypothetical protein [Croceibacterium selenioxidans]